MYRWLGSLLVGIAFVILTWVMIGDHPDPGGGIVLEYFGEVIMVLLSPGLFMGILLGSNIHTFSIWVVAVGNFVFYFGAAYFMLPIWRKHKAKRRGVKPPNVGDGFSTMPK